MSNHNYSQYSNNKKNKNPNNHDRNRNAANAVRNSPVIELANPVVEAVTPVDETVETVALPKTVEGVVTGCAKLNVRVRPSITADVVCVLEAMTKIEINVEKSTSEWLHVCTAMGIEGYCMRKFVEAHL